MRTEKEIKKLIIEEHFNQKKINCEGCLYNSLSQIRHQVCLFNINSEYYFQLAVSVVKNSLTEEEKKILDKILLESNE